MSGPSDRRFDLNLSEGAAPPSPDNIWRPSLISPTGPLTVGDSVMKNDMTAAVVARNLVTPRDNRLLARRSDELAVKESLVLSVQCAGSVSNMAQCFSSPLHRCLQLQLCHDRQPSSAAVVTSRTLHHHLCSSPLLPISSKQQRRRQSLRHQGCTALLLHPPPSLASQLPPTSKTAVKRLAGREALPQTPALRPSSSFPTKSLSQAS
ncbi:hypothetical protein ACFX14_035931 [Malus domestica]